MRSSKPSAARHRRRITVRQLLVSTSVIAGAVAISAASAGASYAFLTDSKTVAATTITAGSLNLAINGSSAPLDLGSAFAGLTAGDKRVQSFTVKNTGTVAADLAATFTAPSAQPIKDSMSVRLLPVVGSCTVDVAGAPGAPAVAGALASATGSLGILAAGQTVTLCLQIGLAPTTDIAMSGQSAPFQIALTANQRTS